MSGRQVAHFEVDENMLYALAALPDRRLASGGVGKVIRLWDLNKGREFARLESHRNSVRALAMLPNGSLASGSEDKSIRLWDLVSAKEIARLDGHVQGVRALAVLPDGRLASGGDDNTVRLWNPARHCEVARFETDSWILALAALRNGLLAVGDAAGRVHWLTVKETARKRSPLTTADSCIPAPTLRARCQT
jgi:WD40 repeat protein